MILLVLERLKNYVAYDQIFKDTEKAAKRFNKEERKDISIYSTWLGSQNILVGLIAVAFAAIGGFGFKEGVMTAGQVTALLMYSTTLANPINIFLSIYEAFYKGSVSLDRYYRFIDSPDEKSNKKKINVTKGKIEIKDLELQLNGVDILNGVNLTIKPGEKVGIVGETGSGKSTLFKMLIGYYEPTKGNIKIDGQDIWKHSIFSLRDNISYMPQDPFISFSDIKENICFGIDREVDESTYKEAIKNSDLNEFLDKLPDGDKTMVGPKGITLSGGQRQRIAISRLFIRENPIIMFDEATSSLDNKTEKFVQSKIDEFTKGKTVLTIAHRLSTINNVDRIIVMENGKVVEHGTRQKLIVKRGAFWRYLNSRGGNDE